MEPQTYIFIGMSGSGKGTQVKLLREYLQKKDPNRTQFYFQSGDYFREFVKGETYAAKVAKRAMEEGERQPDFLVMSIWSDIFIHQLTGDEHLIIDGSPRSVNEANNLDIALKFFQRHDPVVVYLNVSTQWAERHMLERAKKEHREDDLNIDRIKKRIAWFGRDVQPAIDQYRRDRDYEFIEIDGERTVEEVHRSIINNLFGE